MNVIQNNLSRILGERKWTQAELARRTGIRPNTISDLYNDFATAITFYNLEKICSVLCCDICDLLQLITPKQRNTNMKQVRR